MANSNVLDGVLTAIELILLIVLMVFLAVIFILTVTPDSSVGILIQSTVEKMIGI